MNIVSAKVAYAKSWKRERLMPVRYYYCRAISSQQLLLKIQMDNCKFISNAMLSVWNVKVLRSVSRAINWAKTGSFCLFTYCNNGREFIQSDEAIMMFRRMLLFHYHHSMIVVHRIKMSSILWVKEFWMGATSHFTLNLITFSNFPVNVCHPLCVTCAQLTRFLFDSQWNQLIFFSRSLAHIFCVFLF